MRCDVSPVCTRIMVTLKIASQLAVGTERNGWVGKTLF